MKNSSPNLFFQKKEKGFTPSRKSQSDQFRKYFKCLLVIQSFYTVMILIELHDTNMIQQVLPVLENRYKSHTCTSSVLCTVVKHSLCRTCKKTKIQSFCSIPWLGSISKIHCISSSCTATEYVAGHADILQFLNSLSYLVIQQTKDWSFLLVSVCYTVLHCELVYIIYYVAQIHSYMAGGINQHGWKSHVVKSLLSHFSTAEDAVLSFCYFPQIWSQSVLALLDIIFWVHSSVARWPALFRRHVFEL